MQSRNLAEIDRVYLRSLLAEHKIKEKQMLEVKLNKLLGKIKSEIVKRQEASSKLSKTNQPFIVNSF